MKTILNIPDELLREAQKLSRSKTKTETVIKALNEYVKRLIMQGNSR